MICKKCGNEFPDGLKFCPNCGEPAEAPDRASDVLDDGFGAGLPPVEPVMPERAEMPEPDERPVPPPEKPAPPREKKARKPERLFSRLAIERNYLLVYILAGIFQSLFSLLATPLVGRLGATAISTYTVIQSPVSVVSLLIFGVTIGMMLISHRVKKASGANIVAMIGAILALVFELGMIFCCFFFGEGLLKIFISSSNEEVVKAGVTMYRWFGVGALVMTIVAAAMGFLFHWKRFWVYMLTHLASLVIAGILLILGAFAFKSPMPVALGYGALQAGLYLLAAVGFNVKGGKTTEMEEINHA